MKKDNPYPAEQGYTVWFTGLPCSGKTTLAETLSLSLRDCGHRVQDIDGDVIRKNFCSDLGFSRADREANIARAAFLAKIVSQNGVVAVASLVSPYRSMRQNARDLCPIFIEVYVRCPLSECERRDVKGMYRLARQGKIQSFTGISDPYEEPLEPEITLDTQKYSVEECLQLMLQYLKARSLLLPQNPFPESAFLSKVFDAARRFHAGQKRKGGAPYLTHLVSVAQILKEAGYSENVLAAGLLHDVLEDTGCEFEELTELSNEIVASIVAQVSDRDKTVHWTQRKANYLLGLESASKEALAVACADKADNLRCILEDYQKGGEHFLRSFRTKMSEKIQNFSNVYESVQRLDPQCKLLGFYRSQLQKAKDVLTT